MTPISSDEWQRALDTMRIVERIAAIPVPSVAAREAYLACLHAANAYIFERTGVTPHTHKGTHGSFRKLCIDLGEVDPAHAAFLARAYAYKEDSDYLDRTLVKEADLPSILAAARAFVAAVEAALTAAD